MSFWLMAFAAVGVFIALRTWAKKANRELEFSGGFGIVAGVLLFMFARSLPPNLRYGEMLTTGMMIIAGLFVLGGVINLIRIPLAHGKKGIAEPLTGQDSGLDKIKKAKELLDAGAIDAAEFEKIKKEALGG